MHITAVERWRVEPDPKGTHVMPEDFTKLVVGDLADECSPAPHGGDPGHGVRGRAPAHLAGIAHGRIETVRRIGIEQLHQALGQPVLDQEGVIAGRDDVDEGIADGKNVERSLGHGQAR